MAWQRSRPFAVAGLLLVLGGCNATASAPPSQGAQANPAATPTPLWPAPADPMGRTVEAGLAPETSEFLEFHVHAHLDIFLDGTPILVPPGIGIDTGNPGVRTFAEEDGTTSYGGIETPCATPCISPLHTHYAYGIIHTESATPTPNTLGQFFTEWGVELSATCVGEYCAPGKPVAFYVNGAAHTGDPGAIQLADQTEIAIVIGTPPAVIPATADFTVP